MPFINLPSVRGAGEPVSGSALGRILRRPWLIFSDSDDGHVKLKKPDDTLVDLEAGGGGGGSGVSLLGPYTVNFDDAGLGVDGVVLTTLDSGTVVIGAWVVMVTPWENATLFTVALGGPDYGPPDDDYKTLVATDPKGTATVVNGVRLSPEDVDTTHFLGVLSADGALVAYCFEDPPGAQGQLDVYALVKAP